MSLEFYKPRTTVIDSRTASRFIEPPEGLSKGYTVRDYNAHPYGKVSYAKPRTAKVYDRAEWPERIKAMKAAGSSLQDIWKYRKLPILNQQQTNYCWINGVIGAYHAMRAASGLPFRYFSPASVGARIKNFRNVGGWGGEAIEGINRFGINTIDIWPANAIDRRYDTAEAREASKLESVLEWDEIRPQSFDELFSSLLDGFACPVGHAWWGHLVCHLVPVQLGRNDFGTIFANSWGDDWEDEGFGVMHEEKATPDEANALRVVAAVLV